MNMKNTKLCGITALLMAASSAVCLGQDNPLVSKLFSDHMVLQREMPVPVWGTAKPGTRVTVKFGAQEMTTEADKDGKWLVRLNALNASSAPAELLITSATGNQPVKIADVVVGDVYLCSGQSNMAFTMNELRAAEDMAKAEFPVIRHSRCGEGWAVCSPATIGEFSAVGFYFARRIVQETGIPIGLLNNAVSGSPIEQWIESEGFKSAPVLRDLELKRMAEYRKAVASQLADMDTWLTAARDAIARGKDFAAQPKPPDSQNPNYGGLYGYTQQLIPLAIKSMLWYQGESNGDDNAAIYLQKLNALITGWRKAWHQGDFPVYVVQLASFMSPNPNPEGGDGWAGVRMAQLKCLGSIKNTGIAVIIDIGEPGNIHPSNKFDTGDRLALWALAKDYGKQDLAYSGPLYKGMKVEGNKIRITFDHVGKGLMVGSKKDQDPVQAVPDGKLKQFAIAAADPAAPKGLKWFWADAIIDGESVVVSSQEVQKPVAVHYAYCRNPEGCNLYNKDGLPASPFRTEK